MTDRLLRYERNLLLRKENKYPGIPVYLFYPKLGKYIPALPREIMLIWFGATGTGKTQWWKRFALNLALLHYFGKVNTKPLFIVNLLEESKEEFEDSMITMLYYDKYESDIIKGVKKKISKLRLNSFTEKPLSDEEFKLIKEHISPLLTILLETYYDIEDNIYNPYGLYKRARDISKIVGTHFYKGREENANLKIINNIDFNNLDKSKQELYKYSHYVLNDDNLYPIVITDHIGRLFPEKDKDLKQAMADWSFEYGRKQISKNWKFNIINIQQSTVYSELRTYSNRNEINWEALKPGLNDLGNNKEIAQDHHIVLGGFNPSRYASNGFIDNINLERANGKYRSIKVLKNRIGTDQVEIPWFFDGECGVWKELTSNNLEEFYKLANL